MGIIDKVSALLPWRSQRREPSRSDVLSLRDGLDRWFERFQTPILNSHRETIRVPRVLTSV